MTSVFSIAGRLTLLWYSVRGNFPLTPNGALWTVPNTGSMGLESVSSTCASTSTDACIQALSDNLMEALESDAELEAAFSGSSSIYPWFTSQWGSASYFDQRTAYLQGLLGQLITLVQKNGNTVSSLVGNYQATLGLNGLINQIPELMSNLQTNIYPALLTTDANSRATIAAPAASLVTNANNLNANAPTYVADVVSKSGQSSSQAKTLMSSLGSSFPTAMKTLRTEQDNFGAGLGSNGTAVWQNRNSTAAKLKRWYPWSQEVLKSANDMLNDTTVQVASKVTRQYYRAMNSTINNLEQTTFQSKNLTAQTTARTATLSLKAAGKSIATNITSEHINELELIDKFQTYLASIAAYQIARLMVLNGSIFTNTSIAKNEFENTLTAAQGNQLSTKTHIQGTVSDIGTSLTKYVENQQWTSGNQTQAGKNVMKQVSGMVSAIKSSLLDYAESTAGTTGTGLASASGYLASGIASAQDSVDKATSSAFGGVSDELSGAGGTSIEMLSQVAGLVIALQNMTALVKARVGANGNSGQATLNVLNQLGQGGSMDLASTIGEVAAQQNLAAIRAAGAGAMATSDSSSHTADITGKTQSQVANLESAQHAAINDYQSLQSGAVNSTSGVIADVFSAMRNAQEAALNLESGSSSSGNSAELDAAQLKNMMTQVALTISQSIDTAGYQLKSVIRRENASVVTQIKSQDSAVLNLMKSLSQDYNAYLKSSNATWQMNMQAANKSMAGTAQYLASVVPTLSTLVGSLDSQRTTLKSTMWTEKTAGIANISAALEASLGNLSAAAYQTYEINQNGLDFAQAHDQILSGFNDVSNSFYQIMGKLASYSPEVLSLGNLADQVTETIEYFSNNFAEISAVQLAQLNQGVSADTETNSAIVKDITAAISTLQTRLADVKAYVASLKSQVQQTIASAASSVSLETLQNASANVLSTMEAQTIADPQAVERGVRAQTVNLINNEVASLKDTLMSQVVYMIANNTLDQGNILRATNLISDAVGAIASLSGSSSAALLEQLQAIRLTANSVNSALGDYATSANSALAQNSAIQSTQFASSASQSVASAASGVGTAGNQIMYQANSLNSTVASLQSSDLIAQAQALGLGPMVSTFSAQTMSKLQQLLADVESGSISMQTALSQASAVDASKLNSVVDIAASFLTLIEGYLGTIEASIADSENQLMDYQDGVYEKMAWLSSNYSNDLIPLQNMSEIAKLGSSVVQDNLVSNITWASIKLSNETAITGEDAIYAKNVSATIRDLVTSFGTTLKAIDVQEAANITILIQAEEAKIRGYLNGALPSGSPGKAWRTDSALWTNSIGMF